jgi:putative phosphoesterase
MSYSWDSESKEAGLKIGVISDTHARTLEQIPVVIREALEGVDLIVHAGDFTETAVLDGLKAIADVRAVCGNMDSIEVKRLLKAQEVFIVAGRRIGLVHGVGGPAGMAARVRNLFSEVDIIIYGHSHEAFNASVGGVLLFNPGTSRRNYGLIMLDEQVRAEIIPVEPVGMDWSLR